LHNIALEGGDYVFARDTVGQTLFGSKEVKSAQERRLKGVFAPLTESANFYVQTNDGRRVLVSSLANIANPARY
jgi:hypothetical protein